MGEALTHSIFPNSCRHTKNGAIVAGSYAVFNATTHTAAEGVLRIPVRAVRSIGALSFIVLLGGELVLLLSVLSWALMAVLPSSTPFASRHDITPIADAVRSRLGGAQNDPLIEVVPGLSVRESNLRGFHLDGAVYYYFVEGQRNYDPLSRGRLTDAQVEIMLRDESGPSPVVIYRVR